MRFTQPSRLWDLAANIRASKEVFVLSIYTCMALKHSNRTSFGTVEVYRTFTGRVMFCEKVSSDETHSRDCADIVHISSICELRLISANCFAYFQMLFCFFMRTLS